MAKAKYSWIGLVAWIGLVSFTGCEQRGTDDVKPARKVEHPEDKEPAAEIQRVPAGDLRADRSLIQFAVYAMPGKTVDLKRVAEKVRKGKYAYLKPIADLGKDVKSIPVPGVHFDTPDIKTYAPPDPQALGYFGRGLTTEQVEAVQKSPGVLVMSFSADRENLAKVHQDALEMTAVIAEKAGGLAWDEHTRELYTPEAWLQRARKKVGDPENLPSHVTIHGYRDGKLVRLVTLGMDKFGLPDLAVNQVSAMLSKSMSHLINSTAMLMSKRGKLEKEGEFLVDVKELGEKPDEGAEGRVTLTLAWGTPHQGDAPNRLIDIVFPGPASSLQERQDKVVYALFGKADSITHQEHDTELLAASERARKKLPALKAAFAKGFPRLETLMVKAPFASSQGDNEWMWVEVVGWEGNKISGILQNDPYYVEGLKAGARVEVSQASVFDYIHVKADGTRVGNETGQIMMRRQKQ
jgi:uncharacterized protein YegJ (DUF2314 family)